MTTFNLDTVFEHVLCTWLHALLGSRQIPNLTRRGLQ